MPKKKKTRDLPTGAQLITDGTEHAAHILFTDLVICEREGSIFYAGGRSRGYQRTGAMTEAYTRELVGKLSRHLADLDRERGAQPGHAIDRVRVEQTENGGYAFVLFSGGDEVCWGSITPEALESALRFVEAIREKAKIVPMRKR